MKDRIDDYNQRRKHLEGYTEAELKAYFFKLTDELLDPLLDMAKNYTTPAIERSILMRMGFSSIESKLITDKVFEQNLLQFGAGHVVYKYHLLKKIPIRDAGLKLLEDDNIKEMVEVFNHA